MRRSVRSHKLFPSGSIAGLRVQSDNEAALHRRPAGLQQSKV